MVGRWPCGRQQLHLLLSRVSQMGRCASIWEQNSAKANGESLANGMVVPILKYVGPSPPFAGFSPLGILVLLRSSTVGARPLEHHCSYDSSRNSPCTSGMIPCCIPKHDCLHVGQHFVIVTPYCLLVREDSVV